MPTKIPVARLVGDHDWNLSEAADDTEMTKFRRAWITRLTTKNKVALWRGKLYTCSSFPVGKAGVRLAEKCMPAGLPSWRSSLNWLVVVTDDGEAAE